LKNGDNTHPKAKFNIRYVNSAAQLGFSMTDKSISRRMRAIVS